MRKSWVALLIGLAVFALMGADCDTGGNIEPELGPLPPRALAATPQLRTYYQTQFVPEGMRPLKIPEGDAFKPDRLVYQFDMGGGEQVDEVRVRVTLGVSDTGKPEDMDVFVRVQAPDGTLSPYKKLDLGTSGQYNPQPEQQFLFEFKGVFSTGTWEIHLRDPIQDNDGRALFRNATLRINNGESTAIAGLANNDQEVVTLDGTTGRFGHLPEVKGNVMTADYAIFGVQNMLINNFTFTRSFSVRGFILEFNLIQRAGTQPPIDLAIMVIAPSGGYFLFAPPSTSTVSVEITETTKLNNYLLGGDTVSFAHEGFPFYGEPSTGVWSVCFVDVNLDQNLLTLTYETALFADPLITPLTLTLVGRA